MLIPEPIHAEAARYTATLVFLPGLWTGPDAWRPMASYLAHRGWEGLLVDLRGVPGDLRARVASVTDLAATLPASPVLVGHDAGALVALLAAADAPARAAVLLAPLVPGSTPARDLVRAPARRLRLLFSRPIPPPPDHVLAALATPSTARRGLAPEPAAVVRQAVHHRRMAAPRQPVLLVAGDRDPLLPAPTLHAFSTALAAELRVVEGGGHWPHAGAGWERVVGIVHRWLVRRLGEPLLERYAEAMAEREADDDGN